MTTDLIGVTIGIGAEHAQLARQAAQRMHRLAGIDVVILGPEHREQTGPKDPNHLKFRLFDLLSAENILYFDADAFCLRPWNPRRHANRPEWVAVRGFWFDPCVRRLGQIYGFGADTGNGGLFLCNRRYHARVLRLAEVLQPPDNQFPGLVNPDEIALSAALHILRVPCLFLDRRYNWIQYGRGDLARHTDVVVAHACSAQLRPEYLRGHLDPLSASTGEIHDGLAWREFAGKTYIYDRVGHDLRPLAFRTDGTIGAGGGDAERYFLTARRDGVPRLVLGSVFETTCTLTRRGEGVWQGRWSHHERMPVTLTKHRAQVVLDLLRRQGKILCSLVGAEVGVYRGETSALLLEGLPGLRLYLVDPWRSVAPGSDYWASQAEETRLSQAQWDQVQEEAVQKTSFADKRRIVVPCTQESAARFVPDDLDLVFLDADHSYSGTFSALQTWHPKLAPDGLLCGHDYDNPNYPGVRQAVDAFAREHDLTVRTGPDMVWYYEVKP